MRYAIPAALLLLVISATARAGERSLEGAVLGKGSDRFRSVAISHDGALVATGDKRGVRLWRRGAEAKRLPLDGKGLVTTLSLRGDGPLVAYGGESGAFLRRWTDADRDLVHLDARVRGVAFGPNGERFVWFDHRPVVTIERIQYEEKADAFTLRYGADTVTPEAARLGVPKRVEWKTGGPVHAVAFSRDGKHLAASTVDGSVKVRDLATGQEVSALPAAGWNLAFSPDGTKLAADDRIWDLASKRVATHLVDPHVINAVAYGPDGSWIVTAGKDGWLAFWDTKTGQPLARFVAESQPILEIALSPDGGRLVTMPRRGPTKTWDTAKILAQRPIELGALRATRRAVVPARFLDDWLVGVMDHQAGKPLPAAFLRARATAKTMGFKIPDPPTSKLIRERLEHVQTEIGKLPKEKMKGYGRVSEPLVGLVFFLRSFYYMYDEKNAAFLDRGKKSFPRTLAQIATALRIPPSWYSRLHTAFDTKLARSSFRRSVNTLLQRLFALEKPEAERAERRALLASCRDFGPRTILSDVWSMGISANGQLLVTADRGSRFWALPEGDLDPSFLSEDWQLSGSMIAARAKDAKSVPPGIVHSLQYGFDDGLNTVAPNAAARVAWKDKAFTVHGVYPDKRLWTVKVGASEGIQSPGFAWAPDARALVVLWPASSRSGTITVYDTRSGAMRNDLELKPTRENMPVVRAPRLRSATTNGRLALVTVNAKWRGESTSSRQRLVEMWDLASGVQVGPSIAAKVSTRVVTSMDPAGRLLNVDDRILDPASGQERARLEGATDLRCSAFSWDGRLLATGGWDGMLTLWDTSNGKQLARLRAHLHGIYQICFSMNGRLLATCASPRLGGIDTVRTWELQRILR